MFLVLVNSLVDFLVNSLVDFLVDFLVDSNGEKRFQEALNPAFRQLTWEVSPFGKLLATPAKGLEPWPRLLAVPVGLVLKQQVEQQVERKSTPVG